MAIKKDSLGHEIHEGLAVHESDNQVESEFNLRLKDGTIAVYERMRCKFCGVLMTRPKKEKTT